MNRKNHLKTCLAGLIATLTLVPCQDELNTPNTNTLTAQAGQLHVGSITVEGTTTSTRASATR